MKSQENQDFQVERKSDFLCGKNLAFAICGGIAAVESVKIARELRRHGANVKGYMTEGAEKFITPLSVEWATQNKVVTGFDSSADHLEKYDLILVAPLTLSTLNKVAVGIADSCVTLLIAAHLGPKTPMLLVPTMNADMTHHPLFQKNVSLLESWGAEFLYEEIKENKLKMPAPERITQQVLAKVGKK